MVLLGIIGGVLGALGGSSPSGQRADSTLHLLAAPAVLAVQDLIPPPPCC